ncbi:hypothetical protein M3Y96_01189700 [Aphelenchoides besseyi]|nr:hypothetical protein M3Y96_01189700 [Aphelenchoides besseyi]
MQSSCFLVLCILPFVAYGAVTTSCKDWCPAFCLDSCKSTNTTPICMGDLRCNCICPTVQQDCKTEWCSEKCKSKAGTRKFEAKCDNVEKVCKCQFEALYGQQAKEAQKAAVLESSPKLVEQTFVADQSLLSREFKCTNEFCDSYCTKKSDGRKFEAACDESQSCHCKYENPMGGFGLQSGTTKTIELTASSNKTAAIHANNVANVTKAECTPKWCDDYCVTKSNGRKYEAKCESPLSCTCKYEKQPLSVKDKNGAPMTSKFHCTKTWCENYCESKSNGRKFEAQCDESEACKCQYVWQRTSVKTVSVGGPVKDHE